jgi:glycosyltransferase involved in cell wall biosynthesis
MDNKLFISFDSSRIITAVSDHPIVIRGETAREIDVRNMTEGYQLSLVGKRIPPQFLKAEDYMLKPTSELRIALICNWQTKCGISTYSKYLHDAMKPMVKEIGIFSEDATETERTGEDSESVFRCWNRGQSLLPLARKVLDWNPDFIIVQHEFGIFPNLFYFMQMMQQFSNTPYAVTMHSIFEHLDKIVYSDCVKNIVVHSQQAKDILLKNGHNTNIHVIGHGCIPQSSMADVSELWNICHNPFTIMQFGFGFQYKGVERALEAIHQLKMNHEKYKNIFYFYLLSENEHTKRSHDDYYRTLMEKIHSLGLEANVAINRKFQTDKMLSLYLRLAKLAIFPYVTTTNNTVYAASGAVRVAMSHRIPVIASDAHLFDDLNGVIPRPGDADTLASTIDEVFSDSVFRQGLLDKGNKFLADNSWDCAAKKYIQLYENIMS